MVNFDFTGKRYIVTGASSGMGREVAIELARSGATVLAMARRLDRLEELHSLYPNIISAEVDVTDHSKTNDCIKSFVKSGKIDGLVHAAGITLEQSVSFVDMDASRKLLDLNFWSSVNLIETISKSKISEKKSSYVLISSDATLLIGDMLGVYAASKAALSVYAKYAAKELAKKSIRVNTISPGLVETEMTENLDALKQKVRDTNPLGLGKVTNIVPLVLFLLSNGSSWITGEDFVIDGGASVNY